MNGGSTVEYIDAVDAFSRTLYPRAKQSGLAFADVADAVRQLHLTLRHLRIEAVDQDSPLNRAQSTSIGRGSSVYARQLAPLIEDCNFTLKQVETLLDKYGDGRPPDDERVRAHRLGAIRGKLLNDKDNVDMFLDTIQLHNPENQPARVFVDNSQGPGFEDIKNKIDKVADRLFQRRGGKTFDNGDENDLWREFKTELEKEGFSPEVLRKHKDVLRAFVRELESTSSANGGTYPTVRGLLEREAKTGPTSPKEVMDTNGREKFLASTRDERLGTGRASNGYALSSSPEEDTSDSGDSMALVISTRDLVTLDGINTGIAGLRIQSSDQSQYGASPSGYSQRYLTPNVPDALPLGSPSSQALGSSPRNMPPGGSIPRSHDQGSRPPPRLAPDRYGNQIPSDAQWTKIKRTLVSPEVLERAGVRYEARPEFVAILGRLSREQIAEFARQSRVARAARGPPPPRSTRADSKSSHEDDYDDDSESWSESDSTDADDDKTSDKGTKSYPFIVNPPSKTSPSTTVPPKPILKNKNENHVRFDPEPHERDSRSSRSFRDDSDRHHRSADSSHRHHSERSRRYSDSGDRHRDRRGGSDGDYYGSSRKYHRSDRSERERRSSKRDERSSKRRGWGETLGAVGIGGAAVSLLGVLAEAAS